MVSKRDRSPNDSIAALCAVANLDENALTEGVRGSLTTECEKSIPTEEQLGSARQPAVDNGEPPTFQLTVGDPVDVVITAEADGTVEVAEFAVVWDGPGQPRAYRKTAHRVRASERDIGARDRTQCVVDALRDLRRRRRRRYRRCTECAKLTPPESGGSAGDGGATRYASPALNEATGLCSELVTGAP